MRARHPARIRIRLILVSSLILTASRLAAQWCGTAYPQPPNPPLPVSCNTSPDPCKCERSPCSVAYLDYHFSVDDLSLAAPGMPVKFSRSYNTYRLIDGVLGIGWAPALFASAYASAKYPDTQTGCGQLQDVIIRWSDTRNSTFTIHWPGFGCGSFSVTPGPGVPATLKYDSVSATWVARPNLTPIIARLDSQFKLLSVEAWEGNAQKLVYTFDANGRLIGIASGASPSRQLTIGYGADGRFASVSDPTGRSYLYSYDSGGYLTTVTNPLGKQTHYSYVLPSDRPKKLISQISDHWGRVVTTVTYVSNSETLRTYTEAGETYTYTPLANRKTSKASSSGTWTYGYDLGGRVTSETSPTGAVKTNGYDGFNNLSGVIDEVGVWNGFTYEQGPAPDYTVRLKRRWLDINGSKEVRFEYAYDANFTDKVTSITPHKPDDTLDPNWQGWQYDYYQAGDPAPGTLHHAYRVRSDGVTLDLLATYQYNANAQVTRLTRATGGVTDYAYDGQGNLQTVTGPANNDAGTRPVTTYGYDSVGRVTSVTDALGHQTTFAYDALDRVTSVTLPKPSTSSTLNFTTTYSYDNYDSVTGLLFTNLTDPNAQITKQGYDQFGQLGKSIDALNNATTYGYAHGLLSSITDANANVTSYTYDANRRLQKTTFPDGTFETYAYTPDGLLASKTDRKNQTISYAYDHLKRLTQKTYPGGASIAYTYQGQELTQVVDSSVSPSETHTFAYDAAYRLQSESQATRGTITRTYNPDDSVATATVQAGPTTTYSYYPDGSLNTILWTPVAGQFKYQYALPGRYQTITFPNGASRNFTYDDQGRLAQISNFDPVAGNLATYAYAYDLNYTTGAYTMLGQQVSQTATVPSQGLNNHLTKYEYDPLYQLTKVTYPNVAPFNGEIDSWTYDTIGNRLTNTVNGSTQTYAYQKIGANPNNWQRLTSDGVNSYTYDANGNTATKTGYTFGWNADDRLNSTSGGVTASYKFDYQGRRSSKTVGSTTSTYFYRGLDLVEEQGALPADYLFGPGIDEPLAMSRGGQVYYYSADAVGSVAALANSAGTVQSAYLYDAWGATRSQTGSIANLFTYTARETGEAGNLFYRARYYQPSVGRFLSEDPLRMDSVFESRPTANAVAASLTAPVFVPPYAYVASNPAAARDPSGHNGVEVVFCAYYGWRCNKVETDCRRTWCIWFAENDDPETWYKAYQWAGVATQDDFYTKVCFWQQPICKKAFDVCGKVPLNQTPPGGSPRIPRVY